MPGPAWHDGGMARLPKPCVFCAIVRSEAPAHRVYEDAATVGFLDTRPLVHGHVLLVPKAHVETIFDADAATLTAMALASQAVARAVRTGMAAEGVFVAQNNVISQSVPHLHTHIVPRRSGDKLFSTGLVWKRTPYASQAQMAETAERIRAAVD